jgi:hypothetical protein
MNERVMLRITTRKLVGHTIQQAPIINHMYVKDSLSTSTSEQHSKEHNDAPSACSKENHPDIANNTDTPVISSSRTTYINSIMSQ